MAKFEFYITETTSGVIEVEAEDYDTARSMVEGYDSDTVFWGDTEIEVTLNKSGY